MIYDSLDIIPYKTFLKIAETGNLKLLSPDTIEESKLVEIWNMMMEEHNSRDVSSEGKKIFRLSKDIAALETQHRIVLLSCEALMFEPDENLISILKGYGYTLRVTNAKEFLEDIDRIVREAHSLVIKTNAIKKLLPKEQDNGDYRIDDVMASYSAILGFDFDYNVVTYNKFFAMEKQVKAKIKAVEKQNTPKNGK